MENIILIVFASILGIFLILYLVSKNKYVELVEPLDKKEFKSKSFIAIGLLIQDMIGYKHRTKYDRGILRKVSELYGVKYGRYYQKIHFANKLSLFMVMTLFAPLIVYLGGIEAGTFVVALGLMVVSFILPDLELKNKLKKRKQSIQIDFPEFINKLVLLINAGMTVYGAWEKVIEDNKAEGVLYKEAELTIAEIKGGKAEVKAYEDFSRRCAISEINKFISILIQNVRKGNPDFIYVLKYQAKECWEMRKNTAKRLGEEASTKLLFPMMIMFAAILLIVVTPAVLQLQSM